MHYNLRSEKILLTKRDIVKLSGFGIKGVSDYEMAKTDAVLSSPLYVAPEIFQDRPISFKSEIWSIGVILYEMCALTPPFNGNTFHSIL